MATAQSPSGGNYSARGAMAKALEALKAAERDRKDAETKATAARDAASRQATDSRDRALKTAQTQATAARDAVQKLLSDVERTCRDAEQALKGAFVKVPPAGQTTINPAQTVSSPDQALRTAHNDMVKAWNDLVDAMKELERVRGTILVRVARKIGLPPI
jgi:hypothetical protein